MNKPIILETQEIYKTYKIGDQNINALNGVSIKIHQGDFMAIVGKSGSGKSTLMHLIGLLDTPTSGKILIHNEEVNLLSEKTLAKIRNKEIGFVFQSFNLLARTSTLENVMLPLKYSDKKKDTWQEKALEKIKIVGLEERTENKSNELSGGQKQRVAIARALVNEPSIILADEPTGNLDSKTGEEIFNLFRELNKKGITIIIVTHDDELAERMDRVVRIADGKIVSDKYSK